MASQPSSLIIIKYKASIYSAKGIAKLEIRSVDTYTFQIKKIYIYV